MADKIVVPIESKYDDKGAKAALKDAQQIDKAKPTLKVGADTKGASSGLKGLLADVKGTEGGLAKFKTAGKGAFDAVSANAASLATGAGTALAAFGVKAVGAFTKLASSVGQLRDTLGLSADAASRWVEVAGDLGISTSTLQGSMAKMLRTAGTTPGVFEQLGVQIARTSTGAVDANGTFLNTIQALHSMRDPAQRAAAAQQLLGKSWQESAELIELGADGVKARLDDVSGAKILSDKQIADGRKFRDVMDDLQDQIEGVTIAVGEELVPALSSAAETVNALIGPLEKVKGAFEGVTNIPGIKQVYENFAPWKQLPTRIHQVTGAFNAAKDALTTGPEDISASLNLQTDATNTAADATDDLSQSVAAAAGPTVDYDKVQQGLADTSKRVADLLNAEADALNAQVDAALAAADSAVAYTDAQQDYIDAANDTVAAEKQLADAQKKHGKGAKETAEASRNLEDAVRKESKAAKDAAAAAVRLADDNAKAGGRAQTAAARVDTFNHALLSNARFATPAARNAIAEYIIQANRIPASKATEIRAAIAAGDIPRAESLINQASRTRTAAIHADADTAAAENELNQVARNREATLTINPKYNFDLGQIGGIRDRGGWVGPDGAIVAERRPELVRLPDGTTGLVSEPSIVPAGTQVTSGAETERILAGRTGAVTNVVVNVPRGYHGNVLEDARKAARRSGGLYHRNRR